EQSCSDFAAAFEGPDNVVTLSSEFLQGGTTLTVPGLHPSCPPSTRIENDLCRVVFNVTTSPTSDVIMEVFLHKKYDRRFLATGNGGINGCVSYEDMAYGASLGFASAGSNNGHSGMDGSRWLNNVEVVKDF